MSRFYYSFWRLKQYEKYDTDHVVNNVPDNDLYNGDFYLNFTYHVEKSHYSKNNLFKSLKPC